MYSSPQLSRLQNDVLVNRKLLPGKEHAEMELVSAQGALRECRERLRWLEGRVEGVGGEEGEGGRQVRMLPGEQPSRYELKSRLEKLEVCAIHVHVHRHVYMCSF